MRAFTSRTYDEKFFKQALNWQVIDGKWETTKKAFSNFDIEEIACFTDSDVQQLFKDTVTVKNKDKIKARIQNTQNFIASKNASVNSKNSSTV